jgi:hypothetical protein
VTVAGQKGDGGIGSGRRTERRRDVGRPEESGRETGRGEIEKEAGG